MYRNAYLIFFHAEHFLFERQLGKLSAKDLGLMGIRMQSGQDNTRLESIAVFVVIPNVHERK